MSMNRLDRRIAPALLVVSLLALAGAAAPAFAHHSTAAYENEKTRTLSGTVSKVLWTNPHSYFDLVVTEGGKKTTWSILSGTPTLNVRNGWKKDDVKVGDKVTIVVNPDRHGAPAGILMRVKLADGRTIKGPREFLVDKNRL